MVALAIREFADATGTHWKVWSTVPNATGVIGPMRTGWLTFESSGVRRRLVPIPADWEDATINELRDYCRRAQDVGLTPHTGSRAVEKMDR